MSSKMLIDATHREETRVVVKRGNRVEEFDFETLAKKQLRGNIYLAKVTRVEPSLQAAFVDYGGNRHGFLAFSEIHPDYYQIPQADRDALLADERGHDSESDVPDNDATHNDDSETPAPSEKGSSTGTDDDDDSEGLTAKAAVTAGLFVIDAPSDDDDEGVDESGSDDALEEARPRRRPSRRHYKIQEVIKRRQIILVQVVKEERGNKGAALTTYLSLAGRYAVLMPNTPRGGGISRKITSATDRKRLKEVVSTMDVPDGMGVILRTAGANRTKVEIKRDFEYMMRLWETVRDVTLKSAAPALVYEEGSLIKRSIRDLYSRDIDEVVVAGDDGYREAKGFMRMLMPSHARNVKSYADPTPLFTAQGVEEQLDNMFEPTVRLKSGGYLVINQTEALVAIDVNSGKSTKEHNIEDTAVSTNLEAADEIARQLRLRDLAGLVVCDFIDMEEKRNNRAVEKRMKDALKSDRARIQVGRISHFGLMEMSRQRIRTSLLESTMEPCSHCAGTGFARAPSTVALQILRQAEAQLLRHQGHHANVTLRSETALYILNHKRAMLADLEARYGRLVNFTVDGSLAADAFTISRGEVADPRDVVPMATVVASTSTVDLEAEERADAAAAKAAEAEEAAHSEEEADISSDENANNDNSETRADDGDESGDGRKRRRRRRRRRGGSDDDGDRNEGSEAKADEKPEGSNSEDGEDDQAKSSDDESGEDGEPKKRRRSRRGGRRRRGGRGGDANDETSGEATDEANNEASGEPNSEANADDAQASEGELTATDETKADSVEAAPKAAEKAAEADTADEADVAAEAEAAPVAEEEPQAEPVRETKAETEADAEPKKPALPKEPVMESSTSEDTGPKKKGWWQKRSFF